MADYSGVGGLTRFEPTTHWYVHKTSQNVLDHGCNNNSSFQFVEFRFLHSFCSHLVRIGVQVEYSRCKKSK